MYNDVQERICEYAYFIIDNECTIRECAKHFGVSKSGVHADLKYKLPYINKRLYERVKIILDKNFNEKHIRGGESTRQKYLSVKDDCALAK